MTPFETVLQYYRFPERIVPHPLQIETINDLAPLQNSGQWLQMGCGKTFTATAVGLFHKVVLGNQVIVIMPPILLRQWARWLAEIKPALTVAEYWGKPGKREAMTLDMDFILVGIQIFKKEYRKFVDHFTGKNYTVFVDEANIIGNIESDSHQKVFDFTIGQHRSPLTGTPMNAPMDGYAMMKLVAPGTYENLRDFMNQHVEEVDFYKKPTEFKNLDLMRENMKINSKRILFRDMFKGVEPPLYDPIYYDLDKAHYKLYTKLANEKLLELPDGGKIDGTVSNRLQHMLGQMVCNWGHFSGVPSDMSAAVEMTRQKLTELGDEKLVVFAHYKMTVAYLKLHLQKFGAVTVNSDVTEAGKERNLQRFMNDPTCRVIVIQFISGGKGLDGLQHVCHKMFFAEPCQQPRDFHQAVARLDRIGQKFRVHVMMGIANGTTQVRGFKNLLENDSLVNKVIRNLTDLRNAIFGINQ